MAGSSRNALQIDRKTYWEVKGTFANGFWTIVRFYTQHDRGLKKTSFSKIWFLSAKLQGFPWKFPSFP